MEVCTKWWVRRCLKCQARKTFCQTIRWPTLSIPLPNGPGISVSVDYLGPLPITARGNSYILLFTDRFSRRADMFAVTAAEFTAEGTHIFPTSNTLIIIQLARPQASPRTKCISDAYRASPSPSSTAPTAGATKPLTGTISPIATSPVNDNNTPTSLCVNSTLSQLLV